MNRITRYLLAAFLLMTLTACLPTNNFATPGQNNGATTSLGGAGAGLGSTAASDGALPPCTQYDPSTPTRAICVSCYQSILTTRCPGQPAFANCIDPTVVSGYVSLVNNCIAQSTEAGFVCSATCSNGQVIDPQSCTCVAPTNNPTGDGSGNVDVGQTDFGPPIVGVTFPNTSVIGTPSPSPAPGITPTSCVGSIPLYMSVQNRGDTVFRLNQYGQPLPSPTPPKNSIGVPYFTSASQPVQLTTSEIADHPGTNVYSLLSFITGGMSEIIGNPTLAVPFLGATGGRVGTINTVSGAGSSGPTFSDGVVTTVLNSANLPAGELAAAATWSSAGFGARDPDGNVYFSDPLSHIVDVICYNPTPTTACPGASVSCPYKGKSPFCKNVAVGTMVRIAGQVGTAGFNAGDEGNFGYLATLNSPHGIAVDSQYDVIIADSGNQIVRIVCGPGTVGNGSGSGCNDPGSFNKIFHLAGTPGQSGTTASNNLNFPYGVDITLDGSNVLSLLFVADYQNHAIRQCDAFSGIHAGAGAGDACGTIVGNGSPGWQSDASLTTTPSQPGLNYPTDVKINNNGNLVYADSHNHLIRAVCPNPGVGDFCQPAPSANSIITIAGQPPSSPTGIPQPSDAGEGSPANAASITNPRQLLLGKRFAGDTGAGGVYPGFDDNNIIFTEGLYGSTFEYGFDTPTPIAGATAANGGAPVKGVVNFKMGNAFSCWIDGSNFVSCVGDNSFNQLGDPTVTGASLPDQLKTLTGMGSAFPPSSGGPYIGGGSAQTCAAPGFSGVLKCWGDNGSGQVGNNTAALVPTPVQVVTSPSGPKNPSWALPVGGDGHTCALDENASDTYDSTNGTPADPSAPYKQINSKTVWCWGSNSTGQLGTGPSTNLQSNPSPQYRVTFADDELNEDQGGITHMQIASGANHMCAAFVSTNNAVIALNGIWVVDCWGDDTVGQLNIDPSSTKITGGLASDALFSGAGDAAGHPVAVAAGGDHTCAWNTFTGAISCWGSDAAGEVGMGAVTPAGVFSTANPPSFYPPTITAADINPIVTVVSTTTAANTPTLNGSGIMPYYASVALGAQHTCAITATGSLSAGTTPTVMCWGDNTFGQLGTDEVPQSATPLQVVGLPIGNAIGIYAGPGNSEDNGSNSTCLIMNTAAGSGIPYCWGQNQLNQLGLGPAATATLGNTIRIICGNNTNLGSGFCNPGTLPGYSATPPTNAQGQIYTIAGESGLSGTAGTGDGTNARTALFSKVGGVTFDQFKNLVVSDGGYTNSAGTVYTGYRLRLIFDDVVGAENGMKYSVTDSNGESSYWCLRLKPLTYCDSEGNCLCSMVPPTDDVADPNFWEAIAAGLFCN